MSGQMEKGELTMDYGTVTDKHGTVFTGWLQVSGGTSMAGWTVKVFYSEAEAKPGPDWNPRAIIHGEVTIVYQSPDMN